MDIVKASIGISRTIRNVGRLREIVQIFARHGFDEFISLGVTSKIPNFVLPRSKRGIKKELEGKQTKDWSQVIGHRLRLCFEDLGPAFIKFGQLLSTREDLFDSSFIDEMKILRDKVKPVEFSVAKEIIEKSIGKSVDEVFSSIDENAIGTASIGAVFKGVLKDGSDVVVKVRRPNIEKEMETDFSILMFLALQVEKASEEIKYFGISRIVHDFAISLQNELNFNIEALNCERLRGNIKKHDDEDIFYLPKIYQEFTGEAVLVMERLDGIPFSHPDILSKRDELIYKMEYGFKLFIKTFLNDGFFHADLHGGNFFLLKNGKIGLIDFGLMGTLGRKGRQNFIAIVYSLVNHNYENLVYEFLDVADYDKVPDVEELINDVKDALSPFIGLTVKQTDFAQVFQVVIQTLKKHQLFLPREWFIIFRALATLDGVANTLDLDFDVFKIVSGDVNTLIADSVNKEDVLEDIIWSGRDFLSTTRMIPRHLKWFLKDWAKKGYAFEIIHSGHEKSVKNITNSIHFLGFSFLAGTFALSGVMALGEKTIDHWTSIPIIPLIFWLISIFFMVRGLNKLK